VPIEKDDDVDDLQKRVLPVEHQTQIDALLDVVTGTVQFQENAPLIKPNERVTWSLCREMARLAYPKG
jgi:folate-dependent phosphoribosylglycinamide formyltransferase PurN